MYKVQNSLSTFVKHVSSKASLSTKKLNFKNDMTFPTLSEINVADSKFNISKGYSTQTIS